MRMQFKTFESLVARKCSRGTTIYINVFVVMTLFSFLRRSDRKICLVSTPRFGLMNMHRQSLYENSMEKNTSAKI